MATRNERSGELEEESGEPGPVNPRALPCCARRGQFCQDAWKGIADDLALSPREVEVCREAVLGNADKQIARALGVSSRTIETHMKRLHEKLDIRNRAELVARVVAAYHAWQVG